MFHVCIVYPMETGGDRRGVSHEIIKFSTGTLHYIPKCPHLCSIMHMIYIYIRIYNMILCIYIYISHKIPQKIPHKSHQLPEISGQLFRSQSGPHQAGGPKPSHAKPTRLQNSCGGVDSDDWDPVGPFPLKGGHGIPRVSTITGWW
jgi:hypothetical protein